MKPTCVELAITMEFTAPETAQFNGVVEREFPTIRNQAMACMLASEMSTGEQMLHWAHAVHDCTITRNLQPRGEYENAYVHFGEQPPVKPKDLVKWGAKGWMTKRNKIKTKWQPKAVRVTRVGYAEDHSSDSYIVWKHDTDKYVVSRDVKWDEPRRFRKLTLEQTARDPKATVTADKWEVQTKNQFDALVSDSESEDDDDSESQASEDELENPPQQIGGRKERELKKLTDSFNTGAILPRTRQQARVAEVNNIAVPERDPENDREAWNSPDAKHWRQGTMNEYDGFFKIGTWKVTKTKDVILQHGNKPLSTKNVYKKKLHAITKEPRYRVRNCIRGFEMVPGVHYEESFAPTPTNASIRMVLAIFLYFLDQLGVTVEELKKTEEKEWVVADLFDVVQAFLTSELDPNGQKIYIKLPVLWKEYCELRGLEFDPTDLILLLKSQYGSVDSAKLWMDKFVKIVTEKGGCELLQSKVDPCVLYKKDSDGNLILLMVIHVDDGCISGKPSEVKKVIEHLKKTVDLLEIGTIDTHLGVGHKLHKDEIGWYFECEMSKYIAGAVADYEASRGVELTTQPTPAAPGSSLIKLPEEVESTDMSEFRKFVGKILYAVMKVLPDCANTIRDLTCHMARPGDDHWKALMRMMAYLKFEYRPLKLRAPTQLRVIAQFDSDWATDKNDRKSISSYVTTIGGTALTNWQSKKQQTVALSTCEAETMAGTLCAQDVLFSMNLLEELLGDQLLKPSYIYGDNVASLFLAQNNSVGQRTKHIDIRHRFMHDLVEQQKVELRHVRSEENTSDVNSKNTKIETHRKMADRLYNGLVIAEIEPSKEDVGFPK